MFEGIKKRLRRIDDNANNDPEYFLTPILANDPVPYLFDGDSQPLNGEGEPLQSMQEVAPGVRKLMAEAMSADE